MPSEPLQIEDLAALVRTHRENRGLSLRSAADESGISFNTLARIEKGHVPDLETFRRVADWIGIPAGRFFSENAVTSSTTDAIEVHLLADPALSRPAAEKISGIVRELYDALALPESTTAVHLRAASSLIPAAAKELAGLLADLRKALEQEQRRAGGPA
jgi:transcriptional regulator with XRE-family HTH domain